MTQILIAFPAGAMSEKIRLLLLHAGFTDTQIVSGGGEALRNMREQNIGILICPVRMKDMDYTEILPNLPAFWRVLLMDSAKNIASRREDDVMAVELPAKGAAILDTVAMILGELEYAFRREKKKEKAKPKKRSPEEQKMIDDAKALIMDRNHLTEEEAFRYIQKTSMDTGRSMVETAEMILTFQEI